MTSRLPLHRLTTLLPAVSLALTLAGCGGGNTRRLASSTTNHGPLSGITVVLDPGHGGADSGAIQAGVREDVINYRMASVIAATLRGRGATVVFSVRSGALLDDLSERRKEPALLRPTDACLALTGQPVRLRRDSAPDELYERAAIARSLWHDAPTEARESERGLYFLSLHCDKLPSSRGRGARVYYDKRERAPSRFAMILKDRLTAAGLTNSAGGTVIPRRYGVLNPDYNPIPERALLEMATLSNPRDRKAVETAAWRWRLARLVAGAIADCDAQPSATLTLAEH